MAEARRYPKPGHKLGFRHRGNRRVRHRDATFWARCFATLKKLVLLMALLVTGGVGVFGGMTAWQKVVRHPKFALHVIDVVGSRRVTRADLLAYAQVPLNIPLLSLDLDVIARQVRQHPWVADVLVRRQMPDTLQIVVTEHKPALLVSLGGLYIADDAGQLFKSFAAADKLNLPVLTGLVRKEANGAPEGVRDRVRQGIALRLAVENHPLSLGALEELHWDQDLGWSVVLRYGPTAPGQPLRVHMGRDPLERLPLVLETMRALAQRHQTPSVIWADGSKDRGRVQVELAVENNQTPAVKPSTGSTQELPQHGRNDDDRADVASHFHLPA